MDRSLINELKYQYKNGASTVQIIFINVIIFITLRIIDVFYGLISNANEGFFIDNYANDLIALHTNFIDFIKHPWGIFTNIFFHYDFIHLATNMLFLFFSGKIFLHFFNNKRLVFTYVLGGIGGGILEVIAHNIFPKLEMLNDNVIGASGAVMAILMSIAFYKPKLKVNLLGLIPVPIILIAGVFILPDILSLGEKDGIAHFAHLGGAIIGFLSIKNISSPTNIITFSQKYCNRFKEFFKKDPSNFKIKKTERKNRRFKTDEEYNTESKRRQAKVDKILDKISKSGYESLTKKEKDYLFKQSKNE